MLYHHDHVVSVHAPHCICKITKFSMIVDIFATVTQWASRWARGGGGTWQEHKEHVGRSQPRYDGTIHWQQDVLPGLAFPLSTELQKWDGKKVLIVYDMSVFSVHIACAATQYSPRNTLEFLQVTLNDDHAHGQAQPKPNRKALVWLRHPVESTREPF